MFALRGLAVSLSVFMMVYCVLSLAVAVVWRRIYSWAALHHPVAHMADLLFAVRMLPLAFAFVVTAAITVPSFLLLEPRAIDEPVGLAPVTLGVLGAAFGIYGLVNALIAISNTACAVTALTAKADLVQPASPILVLRISQAIPPLTAVGVLRPKILLSRTAESMLSAPELQTALNHETAHIRGRDNLKKLLRHFAPFPGMRRLETAWLEAAEISADDAAVSNSFEALDLASALIKLSRFAPLEPQPRLTASLVHSPASIMNARIQRLLSWSNHPRVAPRPINIWFGVASASAALAVFVLTYGGLLARVHTATEWLVR